MPQSIETRTTRFQTPTRKETMLLDPNVRRWYENLGASSVHTGEVALRRLDRFCDLNHTTPALLASMPQKALEDLVQDWKSSFEKQGYAPDYTFGMIKGVKSWLKHNERELKRDIKIRDQGVPVTLQEEKVPEPWQLNEILGAGTVRAKVSISLMCFSGVRPGVLGDARGTDGLVLGDMPELDIQALRFTTLPAQVIIRREISKARHQYQSFLIEKGANYLLTYLKGRKASGEMLNASSPVIASNPEYVARSRKEDSFLCTQNIEDEIRRALRQAGYQLRPYVLRGYFESHLLSAQFKKVLDPEARAFFGGHKGTIVRAYTLNKHKLPKDLFFTLKQQYLEASSFLTGEEITREAIEEKLERARQAGRQEVESFNKDLLIRILELEKKFRDAAIVSQGKQPVELSPGDSLGPIDPIEG